MDDLPPDRIAAIETLVTDWMTEGDIPGTSVVLVDETGERYAEGFGARDLETNAPATPETLYGMGSITKSMTALAIVQLADAGHLSLADPVDEFLDHFDDVPGEPITIAELLSHSSGMPGFDPGILAQTFEGRPAMVADESDRERFVRASSEWRVTDQDRFLYYNTGYDLLGRVIEVTDGRQYGTYVREEILDPLGMARSTFDGDSIATDDDAMTGYRPGATAPEPTSFPVDELIHPSGGLVSSARELGRYVRAMLTDGSLDGNRVVPPGKLDRLHRGRILRQRYLDGTEERYGYGWMRQPFLDNELVGHGGSLIVSTAYAGFLDADGLGIVVACNTTPDIHPADLGMAVLARATGNEATAVPAFALREKCESVVGTYESYRGDLTVTVQREEGGVELSFNGPLVDGERIAYPTSLSTEKYRFTFVDGVGARSLVEFDPAGTRALLYFERHRFRRQETGVRDQSPS